MPAHIITTEDLSNFKDELLAALKEIIQEKTVTEKQWLRSHEVQSMLNISPGTLQNLRLNGTLPFTKVGGVIYYSSEDIFRILETNKTKNTSL